MDIKVIKKDGLEEDYDFQKIRTAVGKSARRACVELDDEDYVGLESHFRKKLRGMESVSVAKLHDYVESILLKRFPEVGNSYKEYRDFKKNAADALDDLYQQSKDTLYIGDRENANFNSSLTSTKGSLMGGYLRKQIYKDYYMTKEEKEATKDGYIYIHDQNNLFLGCHNCMTGDSWITVKADGLGIKTVQLDDLDSLFDVGYGLTDVREGDIEIWSKSGFVKLNAVSRRKLSDFENVFTITTDFGTSLRCTAEHIIPVYKKNTDEYKELKAKDIREGDRLILDLKKHDYTVEKSIPSVPKDLQKSAYIVDTIGIERWIYAQYGYSILDAMDRAGIENLNTVEDYLKLKKVFQIPKFVENELVLKFESGKTFPYNITNINEFAIEGGWYLSNGTPKTGKYPEEILDIYFHEKIPAFVYDGTSTIKYAFLYGCFENFLNRRDIQYLWGHHNINIHKDFYAIIKSLKIGGSVTETIRYIDETGTERIIYTFRMLDKRNHLALMNSCISAYNASRYFKEPEPERLTTKVVSIEKTHEKCDVYDLETSDHYFICNGYVCHNCMLFDVQSVLKTGFKMADIEYTEPKTFLSACQVIGDITLSATAAQYGGFTLAEIDKVLVPYARKSILKHLRDARRWKIKDREGYACERVREEMRQGLQSLEVKLNTITSSRGDTAFVTFSFGCVDGKKKLNNYLQREICKQILETRYNGQGRNGIHVVFPKLVYLYSKEQHNDPDQKELFDIALKCTSKCMYPDFLSLDNGHAGDMYKLTGKVVSPMGCRSYLGEYFDDVSNDYHFVGRGNVGVVSLNLPMIWKKSEGKRFYKDLDYYLELCHRFLQSRYQYISEMPCSTNPLCFCEGGVLNGHKKPYEKIGMDILKSFSASLGITALNELNVLMEGKMLHESDQKKVTEVIDYILARIKEWKDAEHLGYSIYATPAESLCMTQVQQFRKKFGVIGGVSDREYFTNGFHMHVSADITPYEKQDLEETLFHKIYGGHIQYVKLDNPKNIEATRKIIERAMDKGFYEGVNFTSVTCKDCGYHTDKEITRCPVCDSMNMIWINRISGYLSYRTVVTDGVTSTRINKGKLQEIDQRKSC